jgi:hypothetical protein
VRDPDGAIEQRFCAIHKQLLGLAQTVASPGGENDSGDRHRHEYNCIILDLRLKNAQD